MSKVFDSGAELDSILDELMLESGDASSLDDMMDDDATEGDAKAGSRLKTEDIEDELGSLDDDDDDVDDSDLDAMMGDLSDDADLGALAGELEQDAFVQDVEGDAKLSPSEEIEADDMMQTAGTMALIKSEMDECQKQDLLESAEDLRAAMVEGFLTEAMVEELREECEPFDIDSLMAEDAEFEEKAKIGMKTKVVFDKKARMRQLFAVAVNVSARAHNDPIYAKYEKASKLKRMYRNHLQTKYKNEATKRMKVMFARLKNSKSPILNKLANKVQTPDK